MRAALAIVGCVALGCGHPRLAAIAGTSTLGAIGVGVPLAHECTPETAGDCGLAHDAPYLGIGALAGALLGWWVYEQWSHGQRDEHAATHPAAKAPRPAAAPVALFFDGAGTIVDLPGSPLGSYSEGAGVAASCLAAKRGVVEALEARCAVEGFGPRLGIHTVIDEPCTCTENACTALADATCAAPDAPARVLAFATDEALAEAAAKQICGARDGTPGAITSTCGGDRGDACVAEVACSPAGAVP